MAQNPTQTLYRIFLLGVLLSFALGLNYLHAWTAPSQAPTGGNVAAPLNTGGTLQGKSGGLTLGSTLDIGSSLTVGGVPGDGPYLVDMDAATPGAFKGIRFPDGSVQTVAASSSGGFAPTAMGFIAGNSNSINLGSTWKVVHFAGQNGPGESDKGPAGGFVAKIGGVNRAELFTHLTQHISATLTTVDQCAGSVGIRLCARVDVSGNLLITTGANIQVSYLTYQ